MYTKITDIGFKTMKVEFSYAKYTDCIFIYDTFYIWERNKLRENQINHWKSLNLL